MTFTFLETAYGYIITEEILFFFFPDATYDCASLYGKNYKISGEYKLPKDEFLGTPELSVSYTSVLCVACTFFVWWSSVRHLQSINFW